MSRLNKLFNRLCQDEIVHILSFFSFSRQTAIIESSISLEERFQLIDESTFDNWNLNTDHARHWASVIDRANQIVALPPFGEGSEFVTRLTHLITVATELETPSSKSDMEVDFQSIDLYLRGKLHFGVIADFVTHFRTIKRVLLTDTTVSQHSWVYLVLRCMPSLASVATPSNNVSFSLEVSSKLGSLFPSKGFKWANFYKGNNSLLYRQTTCYMVEPGDEEVVMARKRMLDLKLLDTFYTKNALSDLRECLNERWMMGHHERTHRMLWLVPHCTSFKLTIQEWYTLIWDYTSLFDAIAQRIRQGHTNHHYKNGRYFLDIRPTKLTLEAAQVIIHLAEHGFHFTNIQLDREANLNIYHMVVVKHNVHLHTLVDLLDFDFVRDTPSDSIILREIVAATETHNCKARGYNETAEQLIPLNQLAVMLLNGYNPLMAKVTNLLTPALQELIKNGSFVLHSTALKRAREPPSSDDGAQPHKRVRLE